MKIGMIGLGAIAQKAYLPVLAEKENIELVLCTRNSGTLERLAKKYRVQEKVQTVEDLISKGIQAAIVSTATEAHAEIAEKLLKHHIPVYIDKPISLDYDKSKKIAELAMETGTIAMTGFNRRFIPMVRELKEHGKARLVLMQKNRFASPDHIRRFVVEDFIHVVDTLRFLMDTEVKDVKVQALRNGDVLHHVIVQLIGDGCTAIGIMNRNGGVTEEIIEYHTESEKFTVDSLVETTRYHNKETSLSKFGDWVPTLHKRGFYQMTDAFLDAVQQNQQPDPSIEDSLLTHQICERIVKMIDPDA
ncbi:Gfo/Idh/MocA family oxidoreductase [Metabacillus sp. GX 13764]|uniref:Gfo/Idh/MocA family protein n=1 Tax=Metabacillus kandeliae TaxID=2900151 RepID=UPI001E2F0115|nr:Gfo/Idh/MocA family oxidoreductase [Metabacillus kandeliae]MCD7035385.1 Gfo/Idh/MocA family oxidoreductase [Metabacillus kandeliae]